MADLRLIYGFHAVTSRIRQNPDGVMEIYLQSQRQDPRMRELIKLAEAAGVRMIPVDAARLDGMAGGARHQGVLGQVVFALVGDAVPGTTKLYLQAQAATT